MPKIKTDLLKVKGEDGKWHYVPAVGENGTTSGAVLYDREQSLTEEEQARARENIGAVSGDEVEGAIGEFADEVQTALEDKITSPQTAAVGDVLTVEEVNEDGKPVKWKGIDKIPTDNLPVLGRYEGFNKYDCVGMICNVADSIELTGADPALYKLCKLIPRFAQHGNEGLGYSDGAVNLMTTRDVKIHTQTTEADFQNIDYSANIYLDHGGEMDEKWGLTKEDFPIISYPLNQTGSPPRWTHLVYTASGKIYRTSNAATSAYGDKYTAVLMNPQPTIELDETLTESGKAADSKAVGEKFAEIEDEYATRLDEITDTLDSVDEVLSEHGEKISSNSEKITELEEKVDGVVSWDYTQGLPEVAGYTYSGTSGKAVMQSNGVAMSAGAKYIFPFVSAEESTVEMNFTIEKNSSSYWGFLVTVSNGSKGIRLSMQTGELYFCENTSNNLWKCSIAEGMEHTLEIIFYDTVKADVYLDGEMILEKAISYPTYTTTYLEQNNSGVTVLHSIKYKIPAAETYTKSEIDEMFGTYVTAVDALIGGSDGNS